jgi:urease accessory protein
VHQSAWVKSVREISPVPHTHTHTHKQTLAMASNPVCDFKLAPGQGSAALEQQAQQHVHTHDSSSAPHSHHHGDPAKEHGHTHEIMENAGKFSERDLPNHENRDWEERAFTVGIGG